ncbi:MAG: 16S rRNA (cytosine(1402)-N(4))-methyltransferase RsmH [Gammaproteobacteria bacterium]|uniref:Ribosomal RNA small subunit methyltransferase H n=1 Tax=Candidatus Thiopontia autotrophica TaxID=2841688 RepID=A0A8J6P8D8_9GAMM|nr:16S rRNA (cytosine(1402)-N(4))-methyltransferase RsmH [Candidatus Thiopontia autotrophica]MBL6969695.1 16S rRNA (cytosine(1402)-N(4))-methyltransferase RsmH [Gammaproteobacteria bacterium]
MSISDQGHHHVAHYSVMLEEAVAGLNIKPDGFYVDATFGRGGHAAEILKRLSSHGRLLLMDRDPVAVQAAEERFSEDSRVSIVHAPFSDLKMVLLHEDMAIDGLLLDLGVSSPQLDQAERGFSFMKQGPLDMRMNPQQGTSAAEWIKDASQDEIANVLWEFGDERHSRRVARAIVRARDEDPINTTLQLAEIVRRSIPGKQKRHPATKTFQAIRIYLNRELDELGEVLDQAVELLNTGGRVAVISFHSLEDRMVKRFFRKCEKGESNLPPDLPIRSIEHSGVMRVIGKAQFPSADEISINPRSRSAVLRVAEKLELPGERGE